MTAHAPGADDQARDQPRPHSVRVPVPAAAVRADDGDTIAIAWGQAEAETVRVLGIDAPETRHVEHDIPFDQPFGPEALAFARGAFAAAERIELMRASTLDPFSVPKPVSMIAKPAATPIVCAGP